MSPFLFPSLLQACRLPQALTPRAVQNVFCRAFCLLGLIQNQGPESTILSIGGFLLVLRIPVLVVVLVRYFAHLAILGQRPEMPHDLWIHDDALESIAAAAVHQLDVKRLVLALHDEIEHLSRTTFVDSICKRAHCAVGVVDGALAFGNSREDTPCPADVLGKGHVGLVLEDGELLVLTGVVAAMADPEDVPQVRVGVNVFVGGVGVVADGVGDEGHLILVEVLC